MRFAAAMQRAVFSHATRSTWLSLGNGVPIRAACVLLRLGSARQCPSQC